MKIQLSPKYKKFIILLLVVLSVEYVFAKLIYNKLVDEAHILHIAYGRLATEEQRRYDIVTRTIDAVNKYVEMEGRVFNRLAELNGLIEDGAGEVLMDKTKSEIIVLMNSLTLLAEDYPGLRAKGPYVLLMETIQETGKKITEERMNYNKATYEYNMYCKLFPYNIFARVLGFHDEPLYKADAGAVKVPVIENL